MKRIVSILLIVCIASVTVFSAETLSKSELETMRNRYLKMERNGKATFGIGMAGFGLGIAAMFVSIPFGLNGADGAFYGLLYGGEIVASIGGVAAIVGIPIWIVGSAQKNRYQRRLDRVEASPTAAINFNDRSISMGLKVAF